MSESDLRNSGEPEEIGFAAAMAELTAIVSELETDQLDVDLLADRVERAAFLVETCRGRLDATRLRVDEIVYRLDGTAPVTAGGQRTTDRPFDEIEDDDGAET